MEQTILSNINDIVDDEAHNNYAAQDASYSIFSRSYFNNWKSILLK